MNKLKAKYKYRGPAHHMSVLYRGIRSQLGRLRRGRSVSTDSISTKTETGQLRKRQRRQEHRPSQELSVRISVLGKKTAGVDKAIVLLKKSFSEAYTTDKVENEVVSQLSDNQIVRLRKKAENRDVKLEIEADVDRIVVRGQPTDVSGMVGDIWKEINKRTKKNQEVKQAQLVFKKHWMELQNTREEDGFRFQNKSENWDCLLHGWAHSLKYLYVREQFILDLKAKSWPRTTNRSTNHIEAKGEGNWRRSVTLRNQLVLRKTLAP